MSSALLEFRCVIMLVTVSSEVGLILNVGCGEVGGGVGGVGSEVGGEGIVWLVLCPTVVKWSFSLFAMVCGSV